MKRVILLVLPLMVAGLCVNQVAALTGVRREINLSGDDINDVVPKGKAVFRETPETGGGFTIGRPSLKIFRVKVEQVNLPDDTRLTVKVNDNRVGRLRLNLGTGKLELNSAKGDTVPFIRGYDEVTVTDSNGTVLLSGQF